jgi:hypothetical protein
VPITASNVHKQFISGPKGFIGGFTDLNMKKTANMLFFDDEKKVSPNSLEDKVQGLHGRT